MSRTMLSTLALSHLNPPTLQDCSASLRYLLRAINYQAIESAYALQPGARIPVPSGGHRLPAGGRRVPGTSRGVI